MSIMVGLAGLLVVTAGAVIACLAPRFPVERELAETAAGVLLLGGFAIMGSALPVMI